MTTLHDFKMRSIDETELDLAALRGKVALVVNVASECGYTPQYKGLQALYDEFRDPNYAPVPLLRRMVTAGQLGRKSGKGFYDYSR